MALDILNPIVIPEKTFSKLWITKIEISAPNPLQEVNAEITLLPYDVNTGELATIGMEKFVVEGILAKAAEDPESNIAKAMHYLIEAVNDAKS